MVLDVLNKLFVMKFTLTFLFLLVDFSAVVLSHTVLQQALRSKVEPWAHLLTFHLLEIPNLDFVSLVDHQHPLAVADTFQSFVEQSGMK